MESGRRLTLHFPAQLIGGDDTATYRIPMNATHGLLSGERLRPESLVIPDESVAKCFEIVDLSVQESGMEAIIVVLPMNPEEGLPGVSCYSLVSDDFSSEAAVFATVRNRTGEGRIFWASLKMIAFPFLIKHPTSPVTPSESSEPVDQGPRPPKDTSWSARMAEGLSTVVKLLTGVRQDYADLKILYKEMDRRDRYVANDCGYDESNNEGSEPESIKQVISQTFRQGLELASFPLRAGSMLANKGLEDLKSLLEGKKEHLEGRETFIPCQPTDVPPGADTTLIFEPLVRIVPTRIVVSYEIANDFSLVDLKVGMNSQLVSSLPIAFSMIAGLGDSVRLRMDAAGPGIPITITVRNTSLKTSRFRAVMIGYLA